MTDENARPGTAPGAGDTAINQTAASVAQWSATYADAERWLRWTGRRRWPDFPCDDSVWAMSITSWELAGSGCGR